MILEVHEKYYQLTEDKVKQEEYEVWFDKLDEKPVYLQVQGAQLVEARGRVT